MSKSERTRQFIIEQSAPIFNSKGLAGTAMSDVMAATKMAKGGLYGHFDSKDALSYAVVDYSLSQIVSRVNEAICSADTAKQKLFNFLEVFATPMQFPVEGGCPILNFGTEADDTSPIIRKKVKGTILSAQAKIENIIEAGIKTAEFKSGFDARSFSVKMMTLIEGGTLIGRILETNDQMQLVIEILKKEIADQLR